MSKDYIHVQGVPVVRYVDDAEGMPDIPIGTYRNTELEDCDDSGFFVKKRSVSFRSEKCSICGNYLGEEYGGSRGIEGGNVRRRSSAVYVLGCGHGFHAGCLLDHLDGNESYVTLYQDNNQTLSRVPNETIMTNAIRSGEEGMVCPYPNCNKRCYTSGMYMTIDYFIGAEHERVPPGHFDNVRKYDSAEYTGSDPPPEDACYPNGCTITGGKRKTKNKIKKKKQAKKKTKKRKQKLNKTKRKNSKK